MNRHSLFISNFRENILFMLKVLLFILIAIAYFAYIMPQYAGAYTASLEDKVERLKSIDEAKIVLLGNSNLAFGINSEMIEEELEMPVVNMGFHGSAGNVFHERMSRYNVTEGDIYIICHTDFADDDTISDAALCWSALENHIELWKILRTSDFYRMLKAFPVYLKKCLSLYIEDSGNIDPGIVYGRGAFNKYGDVCLQREGGNYTFEKRVEPPKINAITINRINELKKWMDESGATLLVASYPIGKGELTADENEFVNFQRDLEQKLDCEVISQYTDYMYEYKYFYDSEYHLSSEGADMRTAQLIEDIKNWKKWEY